MSQQQSWRALYPVASHLAFIGLRAVVMFLLPAVVRLCFETLPFNAGNQPMWRRQVKVWWPYFLVETCRGNKFSKTTGIETDTMEYCINPCSIIHFTKWIVSWLPPKLVPLLVRAVFGGRHHRPSSHRWSIFHLFCLVVVLSITPGSNPINYILCI
jgi:hypothetical protein